MNGAGDVFAAHGALYRSTNHGETWSKVLATCNRLEMDRMGRLFVFGEETLYGGESCLRSSDNGTSWTSIQPVGVWTSGPVATGPDTTLYMRIDSFALGAHFFSLLRSNDGGDTWVRPDTGYRFQRPGSVIVDEKGNVFVATGSDWGISSEVYMSTDHGATWQTTHFETTGEVRVDPMAATPEGPLLAGTNTGIARFDTATGVWEIVNLGLRNTFVEQLVISPSGTLFASLMSQGLFRS